MINSILMIEMLKEMEKILLILIQSYTSYKNIGKKIQLTIFIKKDHSVMKEYHRLEM